MIVGTCVVVMRMLSGSIIESTSDFGAPMKTLQNWENARVKEFGSLATSLPSFISAGNPLLSAPALNHIFAIA